MGKKRRELSHAEVWDDSALIQSWGDALAEYKLYHSIYARGERVEDVIKDLEDVGERVNITGSLSAAKDSDTADRAVIPDELEDGEVEEEPTRAGAIDNEESMPDGQTHTVSNFPNTHSHPPRNAAEQQPQQRTTDGIPNAVISGGKSFVLGLSPSKNIG